MQFKARHREFAFFQFQAGKAGDKGAGFELLLGLLQALFHGGIFLLESRDQFKDVQQFDDLPVLSLSFKLALDLFHHHFDVLSKIGVRHIRSSARLLARAHVMVKVFGEV
jgi:hypothetical protein